MPPKRIFRAPTAQSMAGAETDPTPTLVASERVEETIEPTPEYSVIDPHEEANNLISTAPHNSQIRDGLSAGSGAHEDFGPTVYTREQLKHLRDEQLDAVNENFITR
jgi:hypothetical protein